MAGVKGRSGGARENSGGTREGAGRPVGATKAASEKAAYKTRNWATIIYPESEKPGWRDTLRSWCVQAFVSPLHDSDKNPTGEAKKPHYHVLVMWDGPRSRKLMEERFKELGGVGCQACNSARGYARYLCHLDNPEKYQYDVDAIEAFGGADYAEVTEMESDRRKMVAEMCVWCRETGCISFAELMDYARVHRDDWFRAITSSCTLVMSKYIRAIEYEGKAGKYRQPVKEPVEAEARELSELERAQKQVRDLEQRLAEARYMADMLGRKAQREAEEGGGNG